MARMETLKHLRVGELDLESGGDVARIERNLFATEDGETFEALRFCKNRHGRHNRVHLVIKEGAFVALFEDAINKGVFHEEMLERLYEFLQRRKAEQSPGAEAPRNPLLEVIGIGSDGSLAQGIDEELYGENPA